MTKIAVHPLPWTPASAETYDLLLGSVGFERRAWHIPSQLYSRSMRRVACGFRDRQTLHYARNRKAFAAAGFEIEDKSDQDFAGWWANVLAGLPANRPLRICIDVSSMSRLRIATVIASFIDTELRAPIDVDFVYAVARFRNPPETDCAIEVCAPVHSTFAGWWSEPERPAAVVFGLGYEQERAVGAWEYIEPARVWAFIPTGEDPRYDARLRSANAHLWEILPQDRVVSYAVDRPFECFAALESLAYGNLGTTRVIFVPFGPKIFAVCCLLAASVHWPSIAVWRVSAGQSEPAVDRIATGKVIGLTARFSS